MTLGRVIMNGPKLDSRYMLNNATYHNESDMLWLDGLLTNPS